MSTTNSDAFFKDRVLGHPSGLFVLFFTEMWERFSYYGMRAILVIFLTGAILGDNPGWGWSTPAALSLLGTYAMLVYLPGQLIEPGRRPGMYMARRRRLNATTSPDGCRRARASARAGRVLRGREHGTTS